MKTSSSDVDVTLTDGTTVHIRPMHRTDAGRLVRFHHCLSPETTRLRFFNVHPELGPGEVDRFTHVDHDRREALVATVGDEIIGVARYDRDPTSASAEVAFVVADEWQGRGVGTALYELLAARAREHGIVRLTATTLVENDRMRHVLHHGSRLVRSRFEDGVVDLEIDLEEEHR